MMELNGGIASFDGKAHDIWCLGSVVHHAAVWLMTLRLMIQIKNYHVLVRAFLCLRHELTAFDYSWESLTLVFNL